jgi:hypothetical protein
MRKAGRRVTLLLLCWSSLSAVLPLAYGADRKEIIRSARQSYYSLKAQGVTEFRCQVSLNWESIANALKADNPVGRAQILPVLKRTHFELLVGRDGASTASRRSDVAPPTEEVAQRIRKVTDSTEKMLTGFIHTWSGFMMNSPLPDADSEYQLEDLGERYRLTYKEGPGNVVTSMTHDFAIDETTLTLPGFEATFHPHFTGNKNGLVLVDYEATFKVASSDPGQMSVKIEYRGVEGLSLPSTVAVTVKPMEILLTFTHYQVKRR